MPGWTTPPVFTNTLLSAAALNILSDDISYLFGLALTANIPIVRFTLGVANNNNIDAFYQIRHRHQYLNLYIEWGLDAGWNHHLHLTVDYDGSEVHNEALTGTSGKWIGIDLSGEGLTVGDWYPVVIEVEAHDAAHVWEADVGASFARVVRLYESDVDAS